MPQGKRPINPPTGQPATDEEWDKLAAATKRIVEEGPGEPPADEDTDDDSTPESE